MDATALSHVPELIAAYMRASASHGPGSRTGPFTVGLDPHSDDPMRNYAVPDQGARPTAADVDALIAFFRAGQRIPRLEYIEESAPASWPALAAAGFTGLVFLEAEPGEEQIYRRTGFTDATTKLWTSLR